MCVVSIAYLSGLPKRKGFDLDFNGNHMSLYIRSLPFHLRKTL